MKILAIGAGSMGRRRLRDLKYLNDGDVILYEPSPERCHEISRAFDIEGFTDFESALRQNPAVMTVSTPPSLHEHYVRRAMERDMHVFAELPFVLGADALSEIADRANSYPAVLGISHSIRYYPPYRIIRDLLQQGTLGKPFYLEYSLGNYLPDWHPYEDYRKFYASDMRLGGAGMDMLLHELGPMQWWLGKVESVYARLTKLSALEVQGPDNHDVLLTFENGVRGYFHHDILERGSTGRHVRIVGEEGTIEWHGNQPAVRVYHHGESHELGFDQAGDWQEALVASQTVDELAAAQSTASGSAPTNGGDAFSYESCYLREMRHFLDTVRGTRQELMTSMAEEVHTAAVFQAILRSDEEKREVKVSQNS